MASIKKTPNGNYQATIYVGRDEHGKQLFRYVTKPTQKECKAAAREIEQELEDKSFITPSKVRLSAWIDEWLELNKSRLSPSTYATYKLYGNVHYKPFFKQMKLGQINEIHIKRFMALKLETLSNTMVRKLIITLKRILEDAMKDKSPAKYITPPQKEDYEPYVLTDFEFEQIHNAVKGTRDEPIVLLAAWCGLRRGEIFALKWDDIDWDKSLIRIDESKCITDEGDYTLKKPKSKNGLRKVIVPQDLMTLLAELKKTQVKKPMKSKKPEDKHLIFNLRPDHYSTWFSDLLREKDLPKIRFHDLRHYHATWLYNNDIPDQYAAQRLGHDINVLKGIYQHLGVDKKNEIDDKVRSILDKKTNKQ